MYLEIQLIIVLKVISACIVNNNAGPISSVVRLA